MQAECLLNIRSHIADIVLNSGRMIFRLGKYHRCIETAGMDYSLVMVGQSQAQLGAPIGLCLPSYCTQQQIKTVIDLALRKLNLPLTVISVNNHIPQFNVPYTWVFFLTIFLLVALTLLMAISSCSHEIGKHRIFGHFSIQQSMKIFKYQENKLNVLNGVRTLAMLWVIFGHDFATEVGLIENTLTFQKNQLQKTNFLLVEAAYFAVDTFFFIGGFLAAYAVLKETSVSLLKYPLAIVSRYLRFLPSYLLAMLIYSSVMGHFSSGPFSLFIEQVVRGCDTMWRPLLYIDNLVENGRNQCMNWGWYLQNDMQMFVYCMIILMVYSRSKFAGNLMIFASMAASFAYTMQQTFDHGYKNITHFADADTDNLYQLDLYIKPWSRCPPYLYGLLLGILYYEFLAAEKQEKTTYKISQQALSKLKRYFINQVWARRLFQLAGIFLGCFICFIPVTAQGDRYWPQYVHSLYLTYGKTFFVVSLSMIILPSLLGINSMLCFILDTKFFNFTAKISFWTYLIHLIVIIQYFTTRTIDYYQAYIPTYLIFTSHSVFSATLGFFFTLLVEIPFSKLQKQFMQSILSSTKQNKEAQWANENAKIMKTEEVFELNKNPLTENINNADAPTE